MLGAGRKGFTDRFSAHPIRKKGMIHHAAIDGRNVFLDILVSPAGNQGPRAPAFATAPTSRYERIPKATWRHGIQIATT